MSSIFSKFFPSGHNFLSPLKFTSCLGQGSFGIVLNAIDKSETSTAVKFLFTTEVNEKEQHQILRECQLATDCDHPNVVKILNVAVEKLTATDVEKIFKNITRDEKCLSLRDLYVGKAKRYKTVEAVCIQMELCGENLRQWLNGGQRGSIMQLKPVIVAKNIITGLKYLHDNKIIHRDLKPENVMFSKSGYQCPVKIGDFGLCRRVHSEESRTSSLTSRMGTQDYMAPEAFTNKYSYQADLFSLGLVIWEVVYLIPFEERRNSFYQLVNNEDVSFVTEHPQMAGLKELIIGMTKKKKEDRIQSIDDVLKVSESWKDLDLTGQEFTPRNGDELKACFESLPSGATIRLGKGEYVGEFLLKMPNVRICGVDGTVLNWMGPSACLTIVGNGCSVLNVTVLVKGVGNVGIELRGSKNEIRNVKFTGGYPSLHVAGDDNKLQNLKLTNSARGIWINGCKNIVEEVDMENVAMWGISVTEKSNENSFSNISGRNVKNGIWLNGSNNSISNVNLVKNSEDSEFWGVVLWSGILNSIKIFSCSGYKTSKDDWGLVIDSKKCSVENSECGPILVGGSNATLTNVECGKLIRVDSADVTLMKCHGKKLKALKKVATIECKFDHQYASDVLFNFS